MKKKLTRSLGELFFGYLSLGRASGLVTGGERREENVLTSISVFCYFFIIVTLSVLYGTHTRLLYGAVVFCNISLSILLSLLLPDIYVYFWL